MTLVCFASFKGSPGVTSTALAAAAAWPSLNGRRKLFLEADADGGSLALRYQIPTKPGLISLAAAARPGLDRDQLWDHAQVLPGGLPVVVAPDGPEQASAVLRGIGRELAAWLAALNDVDVIADLGRLSAGSPALELARAAAVVLVVARPVATQLQPSAQRMAALADHLGLRVGWVLIGNKPYSADQVGAAYGFPVARVLPVDNRAAQALEAGTNPGRVRRSSLIRNVASMAHAMAKWSEAQPVAALPPAPVSPSSLRSGGAGAGIGADRAAIALGHTPPSAAIATARQTSNALNGAGTVAHSPGVEVAPARLGLEPLPERYA